MALHGIADPPPLVVVSASGNLPAHVALDAPATSTVVVTTERGADTVRKAHPLVSALVVDGKGDFDGAAVIDAITGAFGAGLILCEGGPSLFGRLLASRSVQELFLTVSPKIAGREHDQPRPGIVDDWAAGPGRAAVRGACVAAPVRGSRLPAIHPRTLSGEPCGPCRRAGLRPRCRSRLHLAPRDRATRDWFGGTGWRHRGRSGSGAWPQSSTSATPACRYSSVFSDGEPSLPARSR